MSRHFDIAYSPCPNDTFVFSSLFDGRILVDGNPVTVHHHDIETLNQFAFEGRYAVTKMSFATFFALGGNYRLLQAGNALGYKCGPLLIAPQMFDLAELPHKKIAIPGELTTAALLLKLFCPTATTIISLPYNEIMPAIKAGRVDAGVVIHESRFVYKREQLLCIVDLGAWWEQTANAPLPLGAIGVRADLDPSLDKHFERAIRQSIVNARSDFSVVEQYIKNHAIEKDSATINNHIDLFVNDFTYDLGDAGMRAITVMQTMIQGVLK